MLMHVPTVRVPYLENTVALRIGTRGMPNNSVSILRTPLSMIQAFCMRAYS